MKVNAATLRHSHTVSLDGRRIHDATHNRQASQGGEQVDVIFRHDLARTAVECSRQLNVPPGAIFKLIDPLVKRGYVQRWRDQKDRRVVLLHMSDEGLEVYDVALSALRIKWEEMVYDVEANVRTLANLLNRDVGAGD